MRIRSIIIFALLLISFFSLQAQTQDYSRPQPDCCALIWHSARYLGWSTALFYNTQSRDSWVQWDQTMVDQLEGAAQCIEGVERSCSEPRWIDCIAKANWLRGLIHSFTNNPTSGNRRTIYVAIHGTYRWGEQLKRQVYHQGNQTYETNLPTCGEKYFRLGFCFATAAQLFRHANESAQYGWDEWYRANVNSARSWLREAQTVLSEYQTVITGTCVPLPINDYYYRIDPIISGNITPQNIQQVIQELENIMNDAGDRLLNQCIQGGNVGPQPNGGQNVPVEQAQQHNFVGEYNVMDPTRNANQFRAIHTLRADGSIWIVEWLNNERKEIGGSWSFDPSTGVLSYESTAGARFSGRVSGSTGAFTITGNWTNGSRGTQNWQRR